jgi:hypothetical protein
MATEAKAKKDEWSAHLWVGADLFAWLHLMQRGGYSFSPKLKFWYVAGVATLTSCGNTFLRFAQDSLYGQEIRETELPPPIFILGHWRCGTTYLHELLITDPRHNYPTTYQCFSPCHPLLTERLASKYLNWLLPQRRYMDNMSLGWDLPQEEEFALCLLGEPSPYTRILFPNKAEIDHESLDLDDLSPKALRSWKKTYTRFLQMLTVNDPRRLVLKSPPNTCRIPTLIEMFPDARFIYLMRSPYEVLPSTMNLWKSLYRVQGLQTPDMARAEQDALESMQHLYERVEATKKLIPEKQYCELKYEDLTRNPAEQLQRVYEHLDLGDFETVRAPLEAQLASKKSYQKNRWELSASTKEEIARRLRPMLQQYGYD